MEASVGRTSVDHHSHTSESVDCRMSGHVPPDSPVPAISASCTVELLRNGTTTFLIALPEDLKIEPKIVDNSLICGIGDMIVDKISRLPSMDRIQLLIEVEACV